MKILDKLFYYVYCGTIPGFFASRVRTAITIFTLGVAMFIADILIVIRICYPDLITAYKYYPIGFAGIFLAGFMAVSYYFYSGERAQKIVREAILEQGHARLIDRITGFVISALPFIIFFALAAKISKPHF